jgi:REP element-mobilizing transposase RayT
MDRHRYLQWLYQVKKRYGLTILNYIVTSNHIHLLVVDVGGRDLIPKSMQWVAGRTGQEYNLGDGRGETVEQILEAHPRLTEEAVRTALAFAAEALRADVVYPTSGAGS